ncbi:MAG: aspartoacylase [Prochlorococcaceae cyanobacterium]
MAVGTGRGSARVLVVAGTHGNECNAPWLLRHWQAQPEALERRGLELELVLGNPEAFAARRRYLDRDLNRCFAADLLANPGCQEREVRRARELLALHGPEGELPCAVALDLHSTTAAMGNALVLYGRRPTDLALAAAIQADLGLPVYLHEADAAQTGFLIERWPCGLVIEVGPVPQGVITAQICRQSQLALESALDALAQARAGALRLPVGLTVHRHLGSLDLPRGVDGGPLACLHPQRQHRDWVPIRAGDPMFSAADGAVALYQPAPGEVDELVWPVFINEAAYGEKGIALSLTRRERWPMEPAWASALIALMAP